MLEPCLPLKLVLVPCLVSLVAFPSPSSTAESSSSPGESQQLQLLRRQKRFLWMTDEKRLVMPPGAQLVLTPTLAMPLLRYPPTGLDANLTISTPFTRELERHYLSTPPKLFLYIYWILKHPFGLLPLATRSSFFCKSELTWANQAPWNCANYGRVNSLEFKIYANKGYFCSYLFLLFLMQTWLIYNQFAHF